MIFTLVCDYFFYFFLLIFLHVEEAEIAYRKGDIEQSSSNQLMKEKTALQWKSGNEIDGGLSKV